MTIQKNDNNDNNDHLEDQFPWSFYNLIKFVEIEPPPCTT